MNDYDDYDEHRDMIHGGERERAQRLRNRRAVKEAKPRKQRNFKRVKKAKE